MKHIVAIELAGSQIRGAVATVSPDDKKIATIKAIETEDKTGCVQYGRVQNLIEAVQTTQYVLQKLENNPAVRPGKIVGAYVALGGRSLASVRVTAELPMPTEMEITADIIDRLHAEALKKAPEGKHVLKVIPRKYSVDNQSVNNPVGAIGSRLKGEFTIIYCSGANGRNLDMVFAERMKLPVIEYVIAPLAVADMVLSKEEKKSGCVFVDLGYQTTTIAIYNDGAIQYVSVLPIGSNHITTDIATGMKMTLDKAEFSKVTLDDNNAGDADLVNRYTSARIGEIVANIVAQIGFAGFKVEDLSAGFVVAGRGARMQSFLRTLESETKKKPRMAAIPASIDLEVDGRVAADAIVLSAIAAYAAANPSNVASVEFPVQTVPEMQQLPFEDGTDVPIDDNDISDDDILQDDEDLERQRQEKAFQMASKQKRAENEKKKEPEKEPEESQEEKPKGPSLGQRFISWVQRVMTIDTEANTDSDDEDARID